MSWSMAYTRGQMAAHLGISLPTLHKWHRLGLPMGTARTDGVVGYTYSPEEVERLETFAVAASTPTVAEAVGLLAEQIKALAEKIEPAVIIAGIPSAEAKMLALDAAWTRWQGDKTAPELAASFVDGFNAAWATESS